MTENTSLQTGIEELAVNMPELFQQSKYIVQENGNQQQVADTVKALAAVLTSKQVRLTVGLVALIYLLLDTFYLLKPQDTEEL